MKEGIGLTATNVHNPIESIGPLYPHELDFPLPSVVDFLKLTVRVLFNAINWPPSLIIPGALRSRSTDCQSWTPGSQRELPS